MPKIEEILQKETPEIIKHLSIDTRDGREPLEYLEEYEGKRERRIESVAYREPKTIPIYSETETDQKGNPKRIGSKFVPQAKIITNAPKKIVSIANAFLFGGEMQISFSEDSDASDYFRTVFEDDLKMKSVLSVFAERVMVETKSAIIFYPVVNEDKTIRIRAKVLSNKDNEFYPHFDEYGDMDAFFRKYKALYEDQKKREFIWVQTAKTELKYVNIDGIWKEITKKPNLAGKITVVYAEQDNPEWESIVSSLDKYEMRLSRLIDTNDYFSEPILKTYGLPNLPTKESVGKTLEFDIEFDSETGKSFHGDAEYLTWLQSVDSIKLELDTLKNEVNSGTSTPDISFENLKLLGNISGVGMKFLFMDAFIKSGEKMRIFGPVIQRCVSIVKAMISNIAQTKYSEQLKNNRIKVSFRSVLPTDLKELVEVLVSANGGKAINSLETITGQSPFTKDAEEELKRLNNEAETESKRNNLTGLNF